ncbi:hypothetical protein V5799_033544 [Amblyomma americanum]|uniref:Uncharacterized protein n=1 Tax=Amblyomma americanum TaxID=6943 RepID=A0AAQ4DN07_AMBAM
MMFEFSGMCLPHIERRAESRRAESRQLPPKCQTIGVQGVGHLGCVCGGEYSPDNTTCRYAWNDSDEDTEEFYGQCFKGICIPSRCQPRNFVSETSHLFKRFGPTKAALCNCGAPRPL